MVRGPPLALCWEKGPATGWVALIRNDKVACTLNGRVRQEQPRARDAGVGAQSASWFQLCGRQRGDILIQIRLASNMSPLARETAGGRLTLRRSRGSVVEDHEIEGGTRGEPKR